MAASKHLLGLGETISSQHVNICWSQTPFPVQQPADEVMAAFKSGKPSILMVWKHLLHLKDQSQQLQSDQLSDFLKDLQQTYKFLQDNDCDDISWEARRKPVWLNLVSFNSTRLLLSDVKNSWVQAQFLLLSSPCDRGEMKAVKAGLLRYEPLLRKMGCNAVTYVTVERPVLHESHSIASSLQAMREKGELLDVEYISQGRSIKAHRVVLAAISEKCRIQFKKQWVEQSNTVNGVLIVKYEQFDAAGDEDETFLTHHTLTTMIDYAYDKAIDWTGVQVLPNDDADTRQAKLDKLLDLLKGADFWLIPALKSQVEAKIIDAAHQLIDVANVEETEELASSYNALKVLEYCEKFTEENWKIIDGPSPE
jgi:sacsin